MDLSTMDQTPIWKRRSCCLVDLKDTSQKETVTEAIQKRIDYQKTCFEGYGVDQMELINKPMTIVYGHYVLFIVSKDSHRQGMRLQRRSPNSDYKLYDR